jgi:hypothetical protein
MPAGSLRVDVFGVVEVKVAPWLHCGSLRVPTSSSSFHGSVDDARLHAGNLANNIFAVVGGSRDGARLCARILAIAVFITVGGNRDGSELRGDMRCKWRSMAAMAATARHPRNGNVVILLSSSPAALCRAVDPTLAAFNFH